MAKFILRWSRDGGRENGCETVEAFDQAHATEMALMRLRRDGPYGFYKAAPVNYRTAL
jgi:hypothetical protein